MAKKLVLLYWTNDTTISITSLIFIKHVQIVKNFTQEQRTEILLRDQLHQSWVKNQRFGDLFFTVIRVDMGTRPQGTVVCVCVCVYIDPDDGDEASFWN
jgi:hypothetical protein